jgi:hypothetical protein
MMIIYKALIRMLLLIGLVGISVAFTFNSLFHIFAHNIWLNLTIFSVVAFGVLWSFYLLVMLRGEQKWLDLFDVGRERFPGTPKTKILTPLVILLSDEARLTTISPLTAKSILSSIESRLEETRDINRYIIGLLIFLGLLGTFWGLSQTIGAIAGVIGGIDIQSNVQSAFQTLKQGLNAPLSGMGTAFSCSMFGLAGSLIIGFLDLQISRAFSAFYQSIEERLAVSTVMNTRHEPEYVASGPAYATGLLEQTIEAMASLHSQMKRSEENRTVMSKALQRFSEKLSEMTEHMILHQNFSQRLAQNQTELQELMTGYIKASHSIRNDDIIKTHLRSLDTTMTKLLEETIEGRIRSTQDLRTEIRLIARTLSAIANGQDIAA